MTIYHYKSNTDILQNIELDQQKEEVISFLKQTLKTQNLAIFIGSGCSTPAIPLMGTTMQNLIMDEKKDHGTNTNPLVKIIQQYLEFKNSNDNDINRFNDIEGLLNWLLSGINYKNDDDLKKTFDKIKNVLVNSIPKYNDDTYFNNETIKTYTNFYKSIFNGRLIDDISKISIFTTNYDLFNEYALEQNNISYTTGFTSNLGNIFDINQFKYRLVDATNRYKNIWQPIPKVANLFKLHGSINWIENEKGELHQTYNNDKTDNIIIYPTQSKHQQTTQSPYSELFREFSNCLQQPNTTLLVIGYGFPDEHINNIIAQNLNNQDFNLIVFGKKDEYNLAKFFDCNKEKVNFHIIGGKIGENNAHFFKTIVDEFLLKGIQTDLNNEHVENKINA